MEEFEKTKRKLKFLGKSNDGISLGRRESKD